MGVLFEARLPFPPSINVLFGGGSGQKRFPSKKYKAWLKICPKLKPIGINHPISIKYIYTWPDKRIRDGQNYLKACTDFLVKQGVIVDDNYNIIVSESWCYLDVDKHNAHVYIIISDESNV